MVFSTFLDVRGLRLETWKPRKFVLKGSILRSYVDDPNRGDHERGAYLVDADTFVTIIDDFKDEARAKIRHTHVFQLLTKNLNDGHMTTRLTVSARSEEAFITWVKVIGDCSHADELKNPRRSRTDRNYYGTDVRAHLNIYYRKENGERSRSGKNKSDGSDFICFHDDSIIAPKILRSKPSFKITFNNSVSQQSKDIQERKIEKGESLPTKERVGSFYKIQRSRKEREEYEIKETLVKVEKKKKNNLVNPPFYPSDSRGLSQMYAPLINIKPIKRPATPAVISMSPRTSSPKTGSPRAGSPRTPLRRSTSMGGNVTSISSEKSAYCSDFHDVNRSLRSVLSQEGEGDVGDEGEEVITDDVLDVDVDYDMEDDMNDVMSPSERESDAVEKRGSYFTLICTSRSFPEAGEKDFVHWVCTHYLALPCLALPCLAYPCISSPCLILPSLALSCLPLPYLALPAVTHFQLLLFALKLFCPFMYFL